MDDLKEALFFFIVWNSTKSKALTNLAKMPIERKQTLIYVRDIIEPLADRDSVREIRKDFGIEIITELIRIEGRPFGLMANNPYHLAGAINREGADKGARFL